MKEWLERQWGDSAVWVDVSLQCTVCSSKVICSLLLGWSCLTAKGQSEGIEFLWTNRGTKKTLVVHRWKGTKMFFYFKIEFCIGCFFVCCCFLFLCLEWYGSEWETLCCISGLDSWPAGRATEGCTCATKRVPVLMCNLKEIMIEVLG